MIGMEKHTCPVRRHDAIGKGGNHHSQRFSGAEASYSWRGPWNQNRARIDMEWWDVLVGVVLVVAGLGALYGLHRVCLWLEARGLLYYWHKKPSSSVAACFVPLQQVLEPATQHV